MSICFFFLDSNVHIESIKGSKCCVAMLQIKEHVFLLSICGTLRSA